MNSFVDPQYISAFVIANTEKEPLYLLIRRCGKYLPGSWQMVTGGILKGETAPQAALREIQEETGLTPTELYTADTVETFYMKICDKITLAPVFVAFVDKMDVALSPNEHDAYEWLPFQEAKNRLLFSEQKRVIGHIHEMFVMKKPNEFFRIEKHAEKR